MRPVFQIESSLEDICYEPIDLRDRSLKTTFLHVVSQSSEIFKKNLKILNFDISDVFETWDFIVHFISTY